MFRIDAERPETSSPRLRGGGARTGTFLTTLRASDGLGSWGGCARPSVQREFYAAAFPTHRVLDNGHLVEIVDEAGGNQYMLNEFDKDRRPDIADVERRFVFEVVPPGQAQREVGKKKVDWIRNADDA